VGETCEQFVPEPAGEDVLTHLINGLRRFKDAARWKTCFKSQQEDQNKENKSNGIIACRAANNKKKSNNNHTTPD